MGKKYYYVVLQNNGIKTSASFSSKREFKDWYTIFRNSHTIIAQGISARKAIELSDCIDNDSRFADFIIKGNS